MESKKNEDSNFDSFLYGVDEDLDLYQGIMNQKIGKNHIIMSKEIRNKQKIISRLFKEKFGKNFFPIKLESLKMFESSLKNYLFSPQSAFLDNFPRLKRRIIQERKIKEDKLKEKINVGSLLYLSINKNNSKSKKGINDKFFEMSKNLSSSIAKNDLSNALYKAKIEEKNKERVNKILSYREIRYKQSIKVQNEQLNILKNFLPEINITNKNNINNEIFNNIKTKKFLNKTKYISRNINSSLKNFKTITSSTHKDNKDNSLKTFSPFSTVTNMNHKSSSRFYNKQCKIIQKDLNKCVNNLDEKTKLCKTKLIRLIDGNRKKNLRIREERNKEIVNLKKILLDKKNKKPKIKINNIKEIKSLINMAKLDFDGEVTIEKVRRNELNNFGHYINIMSDDLVLSKINELYTKEDLKKEGKNFTQDEMERLKKKREKQLIVEHDREKIKNNYFKMIKLENDLSNIKDKFNKTNFKAMSKSENKTKKYIINNNI